MGAIYLALLAAAAVPDGQAIARQQYDQATLEQRTTWRYVIFPPQPERADGAPQIDWAAAISWAICHSSQAVDLGAARPVKVAPGVLRIDLQALGWSFTDWLAILADYPYHENANPLFVRGDWLLVQLGDSSKSDAYLRLQFGDPAKLDRDKLLAAMQVNRSQARQLQLDHGLVETRSQVAVQRIRVLEFFPRLGGYASGTRDFLKLEADNSPLELPDLQGVKHDGEEWIIGTPRYWPGGRGILQSYFLAAGDGKLVDEAPVRLVTDGTRYGGLVSIRFPGSCHSCHKEGLNPPTVNGLRAWLADGVELKTKTPELQRFLDRWHLTSPDTTIKRAAEDNAAAIAYACYGLEQSKALENYLAAVSWYDVELDLAQAGAEAYTTGLQLQQALAITSDRAAIGGHLAALAHGKTIRRDLWESVYLVARQILDDDNEQKGAK